MRARLKDKINAEVSVERLGNSALSLSRFLKREKIDSLEKIASLDGIKYPMNKLGDFTHIKSPKNPSDPYELEYVSPGRGGMLFEVRIYPAESKIVFIAMSSTPIPNYMRNKDMPIYSKSIITSSCFQAIHAELRNLDSLAGGNKK